MIDLYTWKTPNGRKISIMLEETGLEYVTHPVNINEGEQHQKSFLEINPNAKIPAIVDQENGLSLFESGAILIYLSDKTNQFLPYGKGRWEVLQWLMWQMGGVGPMFGQTHHFLKYNPNASAYASKRFHQETLRLYGVLNEQLSDQPYLSGEYSIADIAIWPWVARYDWHQIDWCEFPHVLRWYLEVAARPAVQRGYDVPEVGESIPIPSV